jgi:predicted acyl esterase
MPHVATPPECFTDDTGVPNEVARIKKQKWPAPPEPFEKVLEKGSVNGEAEYMPAMLEKYPLMNAYWADKAADLEKVRIPAYVVASHTNKIHTREQRLGPGETVPVEIGLCPTAMRWHAGQKLRITVAGYNMEKPQFDHLPPIATRNRGEHILYTGGRYDSYLLVPVTQGE